MTLDTQIRDTLVTRGAGVTPPAAPLSALTAGVRRRRANRARAVGAASAAVAIAVAVPIMRPAPRPVDPAEQAVAWLDHPVVLGDEPEILRTVYTGRPCAATDLTVTVRPEGTRYVVSARNASATTCDLIARPELESPGGSVPSSEAPDTDQLRAQPIIPLPPGETRDALVSTPRNCDAPVTVRYDQVSAVVDGASAPLAGLLGAACGITVTKFLSTLPVPAPPAGPAAVSRIDAPATVRAGSTFTFRVSLIADTAGAFTGDCPTYVMAFAAVTRAYQLNCRGVTVNGGERRWFEMRLTVPPDTPAGRYPLVWWFLNQSTPAPALALGTVTVE